MSQKVSVTTAGAFTGFRVAHFISNGSVIWYGINNGKNTFKIK